MKVRGKGREGLDSVRDRWGGRRGGMEEGVCVGVDARKRGEVGGF